MQNIFKMRDCSRILENRAAAANRVNDQRGRPTSLGEGRSTSYFHYEDQITPIKPLSAAHEPEGGLRGALSESMNCLYWKSQWNPSARRLLPVSDDQIEDTVLKCAMMASVTNGSVANSFPLI